MNKTKLFLIVLFAIPFIMTAKGQDLDAVFKKYSKSGDVETVSINKMMLSLAGMFAEKEDKNVISKIDGIKVITLNSAEKTVGKDLMNDIKKVVDKGNYESLVEVRDKGERVNIYYSQKEKGKADLLIVTSESDELNVVWITGKLTKEELEEYRKLSTGN